MNWMEGGRERKVVLSTLSDNLLLPTSRISRCTGKAEGRLVRWLWDRFRYNRAPNFNFFSNLCNLLFERSSFSRWYSNLRGLECRTL